MKNLPRLIIAFVAIAIPCALLIKGIYGSFIFSFSIPILWQVAYLNKPLSSLGIKRRSLFLSIGLGVLSGLVLGMLGGKILQLFGLTNYAIDNTQKMGLAIGALKIEFALSGELGYQLLAMSSSLKGMLLYGLFMILAIGLGEELFWRGFIQMKIGNRVARPVSIWITAALFSGIHFYLFIILPITQSIVLLVLIGTAGVVWGYLYEKTGSIWSVAISHGIAAAIIWKYFFAMPLS
ncbi:MAG: type II CAAX endopeptidase family protein [Candidatus Omnitrophota bacterium]